MLKMVLTATMISFGAIAMSAPPALASYPEDSEVMLIEVNAGINTFLEPQRLAAGDTTTSARSMAVAAASPRDESDHVRCLELATDTKA